MKKQKDMQKERCGRLLASHERSKRILDTHAYDSGWKNFRCYYVCSYRVAEGPSEGVKVDEYDADDSSGWSASYSTLGHCWSVEANVKSQV